MPDGKTHVGASEGVAAHGLNAVGQLSRVALEKFAPRRGAEKKFFYLHSRALAARHGLEFTSASIQKVSTGLATSPRQYCAVSYRINSS